MQILSAEQVKAWDQFTIEHEPTTSIDLMERAAIACVQWLKNQQWDSNPFYIFCGKGNNGGDGLVIARLLLQDGFHALIYIFENGKTGSPDFELNLQRIKEQPGAQLQFIQAVDDFPPIDENAIVIDALFGSGLNKPLQGVAAALVAHINNRKAMLVAIDLPSGLAMGQSSTSDTVIRANYTLSFQCYQLALLLQENAPFVGEVSILDIGLHPVYLNDVFASYYLSDKTIAQKLFRPRNRFAHKGSFGHALLVGGSYGKIGAMVLAITACLRSGAGLTTSLIPACGYTIMQMAAPEAMALVDDAEKFLTALPEALEKFNAIGIGPGMGTEKASQNVLSFIIRRSLKPLVIDADGLNCLSLQKDLLGHLPPYSILTPHPKEFDRLFGDHQNDFERIAKAQQNAATYKIIIVLKSHHTFIAMPQGASYFNSTGNAGMAKGGSGDALTGIITSLLAQGYDPGDAAVLGVYLHGWAGDIAAKEFSQEAMLPSHLIESLSNVFKEFQ